MTNTTSSSVRKPTQRDEYNYILTLVKGDERAEAFIASRIAQLDKKNSAERKPTANQIANEGFKADILAYMEPNVLYTVAQLSKEVPSLSAAGASPNRVTALMTQLKDAGQVVRVEDKRKAFYSLA